MRAHRLLGLSGIGRVSGAVIVALMLWDTPLRAHDFWIEPTTFAPMAGQVVGVKLRVGEGLVGDPVAMNPALVNQFVFEDAAGRKPVIRRDGGDPAGLLQVTTPGLVVIGYRSNPSVTRLAGDKFTQYLKEEGLDSVIAARASHNQSKDAARELFSRYAKSLVLSGRPSQAQHDRPLGFTLELVAERSPYLLKSGQDLPVRLLYEGRPQAGVLVVAMNRLDPAEKVSARTDNDGRVRLPLGPARLWMIKAVHMVPASAGSQADWQSFWASLTFEVRATEE
jgi:uncharacterized GH25 family protein